MGGFKLFVSSAFVSSLVISTELFTFSELYHVGGCERRLVPVLVIKTADKEKGAESRRLTRRRRDQLTCDCERGNEVEFATGNNLHVKRLQERVLNAFPNSAYVQNQNIKINAILWEVFFFLAKTKLTLISLEFRFQVSLVEREKHLLFSQSRYTLREKLSSSVDTRLEDGSRWM